MLWCFCRVLTIVLTSINVDFDIFNECKDLLNISGVYWQREEATRVITLETLGRMLIIFFCLYAIIPLIITNTLGLGVFKGGSTRKEIAFTFDDGPHKGYTPRLLDLLKKYNIKATFFVLGSKAEQFPELVLRMHQEGHLIGVHNYFHWANSFMPPWKVKGQINRSATIIEQITGMRPLYYRPPWGLLNAFDFIVHRKLRIVMWTLMVGDWRSRGGKEKIRRKLLKSVKAGDVILLHDSGDTLGAEKLAPLHMIEALEEVLKEVSQQGYTFVRIDEMIELNDVDGQVDKKVSRLKRVLVNAWMVWERLFHKLFRVNLIDPNNKLLRMRVKIYRGKPITLDDGVIIYKGDKMAELHLDNESLFQLGANVKTTIQLAIQMIRQVEQLLPQISQLITSNPQYKDVKALNGVTMIHRGTKQLGFTVIDLPKGIGSQCTRLYLKLLLAVIHPEGRQRLQVKKELLVPKMIVMSTKELNKRYSKEK